MLQGKSLEQLQRDSFGLLPEVATDSSAITRDTLPPFYAQLYENGTDKRLYLNINNSISSVVLDATTPDTPLVFVDRGDPAANDFTGLTADAAWHDLDLSSIVPSGAKAVLLTFGMVDDAVGTLGMLRKNGNSNNLNVSRLYTQVINATTQTDCIVACDSNRVIEYYFTNTAITSIAIVVKGWWI